VWPCWLRADFAVILGPRVSSRCTGASDGMMARLLLLSWTAAVALSTSTPSGTAVPATADAIAPAVATAADLVADLAVPPQPAAGATPSAAGALAAASQARGAESSRPANPGMSVDASRPRSARWANTSRIKSIRGPLADAPASRSSHKSATKSGNKSDRGPRTKTFDSYALLIALGLCAPIATVLCCTIADRMPSRKEGQPHALPSVELEAVPDEFDSVDDGGLDSPRPDPYASAFAMPPTDSAEEGARDKQYTL
jgi:hypothetical protein